MSKVQILPKDIKNALPQYQLSDLEMLLQDIRLVIQERKSKSKKVQEVRLLQQLNECVLPEGHFDKLHFLQKKQKSKKGLTKAENKEFDQLIAEEQKWQLKRLKILGKLAELKNISITEVATQLGLHSN